MLRAHIVETLRWPVCDSNANRGEAGGEFAFGAAPPTDLAPRCCLKHRLRWDRSDVGNRVLSRAPAIGDGKDHADIGGVNLLFERDTNRPSEAALAQTLQEGSRNAVSRIGKDTTEAHTGIPDPVDLGQRDLGLCPVRPQLLGNPGAVQTDRIARLTVR